MNILHAPARDGFALPVALMAMIVIGAIVTGGMYVSSQEHNVSVSTDLGSQAMHVAEYGLQEQLGTLVTADVVNIQQGQVQDRGTVHVMNDGREIGTYGIRVLALGGRLFMVESEGRVERGKHVAVRRVSSLVRTSAGEAPFNSAISIHGSFKREGSSRVRGEDACDAANVVPGVTALHEDSVTGQMHGQQQAISGAPPVQVEPDLTPDTLSLFGDFGLDELIASATLHYAGNPANPLNMAPRIGTDGAGNEYCDLAPGPGVHNWGEPGDQASTAACSDYYPVIHSAGDMLLETGRGQGVLIVDGDLTIRGNFQFAGVVIVTGKFRMEGTSGGGGQTGKIDGTVIVHGSGELDPEPDSEDGSTAGNALIQWDSCNVRNALQSNMRIRPFAQRSWVSDSPRIPSGT